VTLQLSLQLLHGRGSGLITLHLGFGLPDVIIQHMSVVPHGRFNVGMAQGLLNAGGVAGLTQQAGREGVAQVVPSNRDDGGQDFRCPWRGRAPSRWSGLLENGIASGGAALATLLSACNVREHIFGMACLR
jgi:hypothetical protein